MLKYVKSLVLYELDTFYTHIVETQASTSAAVGYRVLAQLALPPTPPHPPKKNPKKK